MADVNGRPSPLEYAIYGVLTAAKRETGDRGARRLIRIMELLDRWDDTEVERALLDLIGRGWAEQEPPVLGMVYYHATEGF